ncbi:MAG: TIR domain-containing protein [Ferruginibacter sp.]
MQIFVSHSSIDKPFVRTLKAELEKKGIKVWLDEVDIRVGQSITNEISNALDKSDIFCFVISKYSTNSGWVDREFASIMPLIVSGKTSLIPCRLDDSKIPVIINDIKYADFRKEFSFGINQLFDVIKIREEIEHQKLAAKVFDEVIEKLNENEMSFFSSYFLTRKYYLTSDYRKDKHHSLFRKFEDLELVTSVWRKFEITYSITNFGKQVCFRIDEVKKYT